jgi:hypothetical protein
MKPRILVFLPLFAICVGNAVAQTVTSTTGIFNNSSTSADMLLQNQGATRVTILNLGTNAGFMGIGILPTERLHVSGNILSTGNLITTLGTINVNNASNSMSLQTNGTTRLTILNNGNVGVGLVPLASSQKLEVNGNALATQLWSSTGTVNSTGASNLTLSTNNTSRVTVLNTNGNVGIGIAAPTERLHISGGNMVLDNTTPTLYTGTGTTELNRFLLVANSSGLVSPSGLKAGGVLVADSYAYATPTKNDLIVKGRILIGTPANSNGYMLAVNGKIGTRDIQIESSVWSDHVFAPTYKLLSLSQLEQYIQANHHLPEVPAAETVAKEGYSMNEFDVTLLKKVEELTLYIIEQQKQIDALKQQLEKK